VPGFDGLRAVTRMHVITMMALSVLAAYGVAACRARLGARRGTWFTCALAVLILVESLSVPVPLTAAPVDGAIPPVYRWLAAQDEDFAIAEYPIRPWSEFWHVYFSIYHGKRLANGFSGYVPPTYVALRDRDEDAPSAATLDDLEAMGVRYLIVHDRESSGAVPGPLEASLGPVSDRLRLVRTFDGFDRDGTTLPTIVPGGNSIVYELTGSEWRSPQLIRSRGWSRAGTAIVSSGRAEWRLTAQPNPDLAGLAIDGDLSTRWHGNAQAPGDRLQLDLGRSVLLNGILLELGGHEGDYPRGYRVELSADGQTWSTVASDPDYRLPITELLRPARQMADIRFPATEARHVRIVQTGSDRIYWWSVNELQVTAPTGTAPGS